MYKRQFPDLVQLENAEKPIIRFPEELVKMKSLSEDYPDLNQIWEGSLFWPAETGKRTSIREVSSNGVLSFNDPKDASTDYGKPFIDHIVNGAVALISAWKTVE